jgi:hypothetical protein
VLAWQDYLVAEGYNDPIYKAGSVTFEAKYYYSQDGVKWVDLVAVNSETASKADKIRSILSGDPSKVRQARTIETQPAQHCRHAHVPRGNASG